MQGRCGWERSFRFRGQWYRFGYTGVNFGSPVSMRAYCGEHGIDPRTLSREERFREVEALGTALMGAEGKEVPVLPVPLVATAFLRNPGARR